MTTMAAPRRGFVVRGRGLTWTRVAGLFAFAIPGAGFIAGIFAVRGRPEFAFLEDAGRWPFELWAIAVGGSVASIAGLADFVWHVRGFRDVSRKEERGEVVALALGGAPLFVMMAAASLAADPRPYLLPAVATTMFTVACVCHDEFVFHRFAVKRTEALFHRTLIFGNGLAFLAWFHWTFVRDRLAG
ncbi:MAG TPA: hypothetical protein VEI02_12560 [Planctomycetota bacterium]|nr:hypothetical protein [Planctomycetota bacterium]